MLISELIVKLEKLKIEHGDLHVMIDTDESESVWEIGGLFYRDNHPDEYPSDWNMPTEFIALRN